MKRLLLIALLVLVTLVGMVGFSRAGDEVSALQATANITNEPVAQPTHPIVCRGGGELYFSPSLTVI